MKTRLIIFGSVALNLAIAAGIFILLRQAPRPRASLVQPAASFSAAPRPEPALVSVTNFAQPAASTWNQIASDDLKVYRDHLLAAKCPKLTVHDIILGEINERFEQRRQAALNFVQSRFWEFAIRGEQSLRNEWGQPIEALATERQKVIDDVLGDDPGIADPGPNTTRDGVQRQFDWLSPEKRDRLLTLEQRRQQQLDAWSKAVAEHPDGKATTDDNARLEQINKEYADGRKELLSPEELEDIRLRGSKESLWAIGWSGFEPTETEWRAVAKLRVDAEEARQTLANSSLPEEERRQREAELDAELARATKETLGPERFSQFQAAGDSQFQDIAKVTQRYGLSNDVALKAYEVQQAVLKRADEIREDTTLSPAARQAALAALQPQAEQALSNTLGKKVFTTYTEYGGDWIKDLAAH